MFLRSYSRAVLCQALSIPVIAIMLAGCGGVTTTSQPGGSNPDASGPDAATGCPSIADINSGAALGKACASEGAYCTDQACNPCVQNCPAVSCTGGVWKQAINSALCIQDAGMQCGEIDGSAFDQSCQSDSDCVAVTAGTFCAGQPQCSCGRDAVNVNDQSKYQQQLSAILAQNPPGAGGCNCPFFGNAHCVQNHCIICGGAGPSCPDGG